jgi:hypothetical protein
LAQPTINGARITIKDKGTIKDPKKSKCFIGFKLSRPIILAVGSPKWFAIAPCETSWIITEKIKTIIWKIVNSKPMFLKDI